MTFSKFLRQVMFEHPLDAGMQVDFEQRDADRSRYTIGHNIHPASEMQDQMGGQDGMGTPYDGAAMPGGDMGMPPGDPNAPGGMPADGQLQPIQPGMPTPGMPPGQQPPMQEGAMRDNIDLYLDALLDESVDEITEGPYDYTANPVQGGGPVSPAMTAPRNYAGFNGPQAPPPSIQAGGPAAVQQWHNQMAAIGGGGGGTPSGGGRAGGGGGGGGGGRRTAPARSQSPSASSADAGRAAPAKGPFQSASAADAGRSTLAKQDNGLGIPGVPPILPGVRGMQGEVLPPEGQARLGGPQQARLGGPAEPARLTGPKTPFMAEPAQLAGPAGNAARGGIGSTLGGAARAGLGTAARFAMNPAVAGAAMAMQPSTANAGEADAIKGGGLEKYRLNPQQIAANDAAAEKRSAGSSGEYGVGQPQTGRPAGPPAQQPASSVAAAKAPGSDNLRVGGALAPRQQAAVQPGAPPAAAPTSMVSRSSGSGGSPAPAPTPAQAATSSPQNVDPAAGLMSSKGWGMNWSDYNILHESDRSREKKIRGY